MRIPPKRHPRLATRSPPLLEALETRDYLSLVPTLTSVLPASLATSQKTADTVSITLTNTGPATVKGKYTVTLYLDLGSTLDGAQTQIVTVNETLPSVASGKSTTIKVKLGTVPNVAAGDYHLLANITGVVADAGGDLVASAGTIDVGPPVIDLVNVTALTSPASFSVKPGQSFKFSVQVTNNGNIPAKGSLPIDIAYSVNSNGTPVIPLEAMRESINLAPGASKTYTFGLTVPKQFPLGSYFMVSEIDPANTFNEINSANNTSTALQSLAIVSPFPPVAGSFTISADNTRGPNKGTTTIISATNVVEASDGTLSGDASINGTPGSLTGSITTAGHLSLHLAVGGITKVISGTVKNLNLTGTFTSTDGDGGSVTSADI